MFHESCDEIAQRYPATFADSPEMLMRLGLRPLLNLFESGIVTLDPIPRRVNISSTCRLSMGILRFFHRLFLRCQLRWFNLFGAFYRESPMMTKPIQGIIHRLGFHRAHAAATHGVVEHPVAVLRRPLFLVVGNV